MKKTLGFDGAFLTVVLTVGSVSAACLDSDKSLVQGLVTNPDYNAAAQKVVGRGNAILPCLADALNGSDPKLGTRAACLISNFGAEAQQTVPALIQVTENPAATPEQKSAVITALADVGDARAVPALIKFLPSEHALSAPAMDALGRFGKAAQPAVPALIGMLNAEDYSVRRTAAETLGKIGPGASDAVPALKKNLKRKDQWDVDATERREVRRALKKIGTPEALAAIAPKKSPSPTSK